MKNMSLTLKYELDKTHKKHWWSKAKPVTMSVTWAIDQAEISQDRTHFELKATKSYDLPDLLETLTRPSVKVDPNLASTYP